MDRGEGQSCLIKIFGEENVFEFVSEGRYSSRVPEVLGETVPDMGTKAWESVRAISFVVEFEVLELELACLWWRAERVERL